MRGKRGVIANKLQQVIEGNDGSGGEFFRAGEAGKRGHLRGQNAPLAGMAGRGF